MKQTTDQGFHKNWDKNSTGGKIISTDFWYVWKFFFNHEVQKSVCAKGDYLERKYLTLDVPKKGGKKIDMVISNFSSR